MQLSVRESSSYKKYDIIHNIYHYESGPSAVPVHLMDVGNCYSLHQKQYLQFQMSGNEESKQRIYKFTNQFEKKLLKIG